MDSKIKIYLKIALINFFCFFIFIIIFELIFGYWFEKYNFGPYMREHRMKNIPYKLTYNNTDYKYNYVRNSLAFRGEEIKPKDIKILMVGGSTTDERYKPERFTIVGNLNKKFLKAGSSRKIINAGIEGQSTRGHIHNFNFWFKKIENFKPKHIIFYVGINDASLLRFQSDNLQDGFIENPNKLESFFDNIKSRSFIIDLARKVKHQHYKRDESKRVIYDFDYSLKESKKKDRVYINYENKIKKYDFDKLVKKHQILIDQYLKNIDLLNTLSNSIGSEAIFINQPMQENETAEILFSINNSLIVHCEKKKYKCIDLVKNLNGFNDFWWDGAHTTPKGSKAIADIIYPYLNKYLN